MYKFVEIYRRRVPVEKTVIAIVRYLYASEDEFSSHTLQQITNVYSRGFANRSYVANVKERKSLRGRPFVRDVSFKKKRIFAVLRFLNPLRSTFAIKDVKF